MALLRKSLLLYVITLCSLCLIISGCQSATNNPEHTITSGYSVIDSQGHKLTFTHAPERIISYSVSTDEILLGMITAKRLVAVSKYANDPGISNVVTEAKAVPNRIDGTNVEAILAMQPDLIIIPDFVKPEMIATLREAGLPVYVYHTPLTIEEIQTTIKELAKLVGDAKAAEPLLTYMNERLDKVNTALAKVKPAQYPRVAFIGDSGVYYSPQSSLRNVAKYAHLTDITTTIHQDKAFILSAEEVTKLRPEIFILTNWDYDGKHSLQSQEENLFSNRAFSGIPAWENHRVIIIPGAKILSLSQYIADAVLILAEQAYPQYFK